VKGFIFTEEGRKDFFKKRYCSSKSWQGSQREKFPGRSAPLIFCVTKVKIFINPDIYLKTDLFAKGKLWGV